VKDFLLAHGAYDTRINSGGDYKGIGWGDIIAMVSNPVSTEKDKAPFAIFSDYRQFNGRSHDAQREHGNYTVLPGDIDAGNYSLTAVLDAIRAVYGDISTTVYSTASATADALKWRYLIPLDGSIAGADYHPIQGAAFDLMAEQLIECDRVCQRAGQPIYLPNKRGDFYQYHVTDDKPLFGFSGSAVEQRYMENLRHDEEQAQQAMLEAEARAASRSPVWAAGSQPVDVFNATYRVADLLPVYGYKKGAKNSWRSPNQDTKSYATKDFGSYWVSLSGSDDDAGLGIRTKNGFRSGDAFDLFCHYEHGDDFTRAVAEAAKNLGLNKTRKRNRRRGGAIAWIT
jgi:hypothetical protein